MRPLVSGRPPRSAPSPSADRLQALPRARGQHQHRGPRISPGPAVDVHSAGFDCTGAVRGGSSSRTACWRAPRRITSRKRAVRSSVPTGLRRACQLLAAARDNRLRAAKEPAVRIDPRRGELLTVAPKTQRSGRRVALPADCVTALRAQRAQRIAGPGRGAAGTLKGTGHGPVFTPGTRCGRCRAGRPKPWAAPAEHPVP